MTVISMSGASLSDQERANLAERVAELACDVTGCSRTELTVSFDDCRCDQPRH